MVLIWAIQVQSNLKTSGKGITVAFYLKKKDEEPSVLG